MLNKVRSVYSIFVGISIISLWVMLFITSQIEELTSKPIDISFHLANEFTTAITLIFGGYGLLRNRRWATKIYFLSMGMLFYSLITANGYYTQKGGLPMTIMFSILTVITVILTIGSILSTRIEVLSETCTSKEILGTANSNLNKKHSAKSL